MTESTSASRSELASLLLPELKKIASRLGIKGGAAMRKADLVAAIMAAGSGGTSASSGAAHWRRTHPMNRSCQSGTSPVRGRPSNRRLSPEPRSVPHIR